MAKYEYILGDSSAEIERLSCHAAVWRDVTESLFDRLKAGPPWRCLDAGAGTGAVTFALAKRVMRGGGQVDALERSAAYTSYLRRMVRGTGFTKIRVIESDILQSSLEHCHYELVFSRWTFSFLPRVEEHLYHLVESLRPGGILAIEEFHWDGMALYPRPESWDFMTKALKLWVSSQGGDLNVALRLPDLIKRMGLEIVEVASHVKAGRPGSAVWEWADRFLLGHQKELSRFALFSPERAARLRRDWLKAKKNPASLFLSPTLLDIVARKKK